MKRYWLMMVLGLVLLSLNVAVAARPKQNFDSTEYAWREHLKHSPHSVQVSFATLMYNKETYKIFTKMPLLNFSATYMFDIPWWHKRTNFFVLAGLGYEGCRRDDVLYKASNNVYYETYSYNQFHTYFGVGLRIHLLKSLDLSLSSAVDASVGYERGRYESFFGKERPNTSTDYFISRLRDYHSDAHGLLSLSLTYEIKRIRISAGCQMYIGANEFGGYNAYNNTAHWKDADQPSRSWATLGVGYRF